MFGLCLVVAEIFVATKNVTHVWLMIGCGWIFRRHEERDLWLTFVIRNIEILHNLHSVFDHHLIIPDNSFYPRDDLHPNPYNDVNPSYLNVHVLGVVEPGGG